MQVRAAASPAAPPCRRCCCCVGAQVQVQVQAQAQAAAGLGRGGLQLSGAASLDGALLSLASAQDLHGLVGVGGAASQAIKASLTRCARVYMCVCVHT